MKYRKKPVIIEAVLWDGDSHTANTFLGERFGVDWEYESPESSNLVIPTLEGRMLCKVGDYIIKGVKNEFYPCKSDIFAATYEVVDDPTPSRPTALPSLAQSLEADR